MITKYIRVKAELLTRTISKKNSDFKKYTITRRKLKEAAFIPQVINSAFCIQCCIDVEPFNFTGKVEHDDLIDYVHKYDKIPKSKIKSIRPVYLGVDGDLNHRFELYHACEDYEYLDEPLQLYCYFEIKSKEELTDENIENLKKYLAGQISDGWFENGMEFNLMYDVQAMIHISWKIDDMEIVDECSRWWVL